MLQFRSSNHNLIRSDQEITRSRAEKTSVGFDSLANDTITEPMSDSNLQAFYAELDARMAFPDDGNCLTVSEPRSKYCITPHLLGRRLAYYPSFVANSTSSPSGPFPLNDNSFPPVGPSPTVPVYISSLSATENRFHVSLLGRESAKHHQCLNNPYRRKGESEALPNCKDAGEPTLLQSPVFQLLYRIRVLSSKNLLM